MRVKPIGELDLASGPKLRDAVADLLAVGFADVEIDLRDLSFLDLTGLRVLLSLPIGRCGRAGGCR